MIHSAALVWKKKGLEKLQCFPSRALTSCAIIAASLCGAQKASANVLTLEAGFAKESITPDVNDPKNPIWIAGFGQKRQARSVNDPLWSRVIALSNGERKGVIVSLDAIGFMHNDIVDIRNEVQKELALDFVIISSTHNHEAPDLIGIWGPSLLKSGINPRYMALVKSQTVKAIRSAVAAREPVSVQRMELPDVGADVLVDTRMPQVFDSHVRVLRFVKSSDNQTAGMLLTWANHPEVLWNANTAITSDYVHFLREGLESGIRYGDTTLKAGLGGTAVFINGAVGGLMTTLDSTPVVDAVLNQTLTTPSFDKARTVGYRVAEAVLDGIASGREKAVEGTTFRWNSKSILLPVDNIKFRAAARLRIIRRKFEAGNKTRSEVGLLQLGDTWIGTLPGELYPEIANGGIEAPAGNDFELKEPLEVPPFRELMKGQMNMLLGLTNDQIGYIIPRSQWDEKSPYTYNDKPYGEENSLGPNTAPLIHRALLDVFAQAQEN
jgi:hypothetical protein